MPIHVKYIYIYTFTDNSYLVLKQNNGKNSWARIILPALVSRFKELVALNVTRGLFIWAYPNMSTDFSMTDLYHETKTCQCCRFHMVCSCHLDIAARDHVLEQDFSKKYIRSMTFWWTHRSHLTRLSSISKADSMWRKVTIFV